MTTYLEDMAFFEKHHLLKTFTNALMKVVNMALTTKDFKD